MGLLTLVRHGQASYMAENYDKLSPLGEQQAKDLGQFWARRGMDFQYGYQGPAQRHLRTAELAGMEVRQSGRSWPRVETLPQLDEFDAFQVLKRMTPVLAAQFPAVRQLNDRFREAQSVPEAGERLQALFEEVARHWCSGAFDQPDLESWSEFRARVASALDHIRAEVEPSSRTVAFTSGGPIAAMLSLALDLPAAHAIELVWMSRNCSYAEFVLADGRLTLSSFNSFPHLEDASLHTYR